MLIKERAVNTNLVARGFVTPKWINTTTSDIVNIPGRKNQLSYACSDVLANILGGNTSYIPRYIGFVYGASDAPVGLTDPTERDQTWSDISSNLASLTANIQISTFSFNPSISVDGDDEIYAGNSATFSAHTISGASSTYGFPLSSPYSGALADGSYIYHAILLTKMSNTLYLPVARVSLDSGGTYLQKPSGLELAIDWQVSFI